jgi:DNA-binding NtrC family response regulator
VKSVLYLACPAADRADTEKLLAAADVAVIWVETVAAALGELQRHDLPVLVDLSRGGAALQSVREIRAQRASTIVFAVVDAQRPDLTTEAVLAGAADVFARPLGGRRVANAIDRELHLEARHRGHSGNGATRSGDALYYYSTAMREVMAQIGRAAAQRAGVLIRGEEGTGRQLAARAIHSMENGSAGAFVGINCAAYDADQLDAELFGAAARASSDQASRGLEPVSREGRLHAALGGTIYLQHVAEAPTRVQARLARVLRDREAVLVETGGAIGFDVRPMAGVDAGFDGAVAEGRVRDDLFRRLSALRIDIPPLRNRREDIPALANYFLRDICAAHGVPSRTMTRSALSLIAALPWRGNASELRTLLEGVVTSLEGGRGIGIEDVLAHVRLDGGSAVFSGGGTLRQARDRFEREYIAAVLDHHHGRIAEAARSLGIQRTNLYRKMRSLRVARDRRQS